MSELAKITCACGFEVVGADEQLNNSAHAAHVCDNDTFEETWHWYDRAFSFWGALIVFFVGIFALGIVEVTQK